MSGPLPFIIDAGPAINFLASGNQRLLSNAIGKQAVHAPESVEGEVLRKSSKVAAFKGVKRRWQDMKPNWLVVLSDDAKDAALMHAARDLLPTSLAVRKQSGDDLGETMVVLHAYARAMAGQQVVVIIDDREGKVFAKRAQAKIAAMTPPAGRISLTSTIGLIGRRIHTDDIPDPPALSQLWAAISPLDHGLPRELPDRLRNSPRWDAPRLP